MVSGSRGKTGACGHERMGALRAGAGLVTVASAAGIAGSRCNPELMTEPLAETPMGRSLGTPAGGSWPQGKTDAMGPGLGRSRLISICW